MKHLLEYEEFDSINENGLGPVILASFFILILFGGVYWLSVMEQKRIMGIIFSHLTMQELLEIKGTLLRDPDYRILLSELSASKKQDKLIDKMVNSNSDDHNIASAIKQSSAMGNIKPGKKFKILKKMRQREREILPKKLFDKLSNCRAELGNDEFIGEY